MAWTLPTLTPRQVEYLRAYFEIGTVALACERLKIKKPNGYRFMADERIKACIALGEIPEDAVTVDAARAAEIKAVRRQSMAKARQTRLDQRKAETPERKATKETIESYGQTLPPMPDGPVVYDDAMLKARLAHIIEARAVDLFEMKKTGKTLKLRLKPLHELPPALAYAVSQIDLMSNGTVKIRLLSKLEAIRLLGQALGTFRPGEGEDEKPVGGEMGDADLTLEKRLEAYEGNVITGKFVRPAKPG